MRIFRTFFSITLLIVFASTGFSQKLTAGGYKISIKNFEKRVVSFHSRRNAVYNGTLKVNSKDSLKGIYLFYFLELGDNISVLSIKDTQDKVLQPKLIFDKESNTFAYYKKTDREGAEKIKDDLSFEEIVLAGMLVWLKLDKETP